MNATTLYTKRPRICAIEGNIGAGKTTIFEQLKTHFKNNRSVVFMPEPVDIWETIRDASGKTILEKFYADPKYAFSFQIMAYSTRLAMLRKTIREHPDCELIICERSLEADRNIFAKMLFESGKIEDVEYQIYEMLFQDTAAEFPLNCAVYIDSSPETCFGRIHKRARTGESVIPLDYLQNCCTYYNNWLIYDGSSDEYSHNKFPVLHLDTNSDATYDPAYPDDKGNQWIAQIIAFL